MISPNLTVIMYHYVRENDDPRFPGIKGMYLDDFRRQVAAVRESFELATLESALAFLDGRYQPSRDLCLLTFDDGLRDHYRDVFPILAEANIQGLFFIATACQEGCVAAVHKNHLLMASLPLQRYRQAFLEQLTAIRPEAEYRVTVAEARRYYRWDSDDVAQFKCLLNFRLAPSLRDQVLDHIFHEFVGDQREWSRKLYFNWSEAREMQDAGMIMGGHSHRHSPLAALGDIVQFEDLQSCAKMLQRHLRHQVRWPFSYPYGKANSFNSSTVEALRELSFDCAFANIVGHNSVQDDRYRIRRVDPKDLAIEANIV